ncbi:hypothetical protein M8J77_004089 [Diaphorina citri]|nr:hypothetical protein M8J77_004089 [Diaphorina citri]
MTNESRLDSIVYFITILPLVYLSGFLLSLLGVIYSMCTLLRASFSTKSTQTPDGAGNKISNKIHYFEKVMSKSLIASKPSDRPVVEKLDVKPDSPVRSKVKLPILSKQCAKTSEPQFTLNRNIIDQIKNSMLEENETKKEMIETHNSNTVLQPDEISDDTGSNSSSVYSLVPRSSSQSSHQSPELNHYTTSNIGDNGSVIFGLGDLDELKSAESIMSFDGDIQKLAYYRQVLI